MSIRFGIRYNIAEIARAVFFRGIYKMHVRITESGYNTLPVTINNFCAVTNPRFCAFVIADVYKFFSFNKCSEENLKFFHAVKSKKLLKIFWKNFG